MAEPGRVTLGKIVGPLLIAGMLFLGAKSCISSPWAPDALPTSYAIAYPDGTRFSITFYAKYDSLMLYTLDQPHRLESCHARYMGQYASHYFGPVWNVGEGLLGLRTYPKGTRPISLSLRVLAHRLEGDFERKLPEAGYHEKHPVLVENDRIHFRDMWLAKVPPDMETVRLELDQLAKVTTKPRR